VSAGTTSNLLSALTFSNSNGISFGLDASTVTASYTVPAQFSGGNSNLGNTQGDTGVVTGRLVLVGTNNITLSGSTNAGSMTISISGGAGAAGNTGSISAGTTRATLGEVVFSNSNGISFGVDGQTVTASHNGLTNFRISAGTTSNLLSDVTFNNANNVSFGLNASTITASVNTSLTNIRVSAGTTSNLLSALTFSNSNGISFGLDASTITASYTVPTVTSWTVSDNATSGTVARLAFTNLNGVTLSLSTGAAGSHTIVGSHNALTSQSNQAASGQNGSFAFETLSFSNANGISFGTSAGPAITASHNALTSQSNQTLGLYAVGNTTGQSSSSTFDARTVSFVGQGVASVGFSNGSVNISVPAGGGGLTNINISAGTTSNNLSNFVLSNSNNVSFGLDGSTVTATVTVASTQGSINLSAGTTSNLSASFTFSNANNVSFGLNAGTITASISTSLTNIRVSAGTTSNLLSALTFNNANGISFGLDASTVTASLVGLSVGVSDLGNTAGNTTVNTGSRLVLVGNNQITLNQATAAGATTVSFNLPVSPFIAGVSNLGNTAGATGVTGTRLVLVGTNNVTLSQTTDANGATVSISAAGGGGGGNTISTYYPFGWVGNNTVGFVTNTSAGQYMFPFQVVQNVAAEYVGVAFSMSFLTGGTSSFRQSGTIEWGLFTRPTGANSTRLSNAGSGSFSYGVTYNNSSMTFDHPTTTNSTGYGTGSTTSAGLNISSGYTGIKFVALFLGSTLTPGFYWLGLFNRMSSSSFNSGIRISIFGTSNPMSAMAPIGSFSSAYISGTNLPLQIGGNWLLANGSYTVAGQTALQTDVTMSQISQNTSFIPHLVFATRV
jgi:hypothetical protein